MSIVGVRGASKGRLGAWIRRTLDLLHDDSVPSCLGTELASSPGCSRGRGIVSTDARVRAADEAKSKRIGKGVFARWDGNGTNLERFQDAD